MLMGLLGVGGHVQPEEDTSLICREGDGGAPGIRLWSPGENCDSLCALPVRGGCAPSHGPPRSMGTWGRLQLVTDAGRQRGGEIEGHCHRIPGGIMIQGHALPCFTGLMARLAAGRLKRVFQQVFPAVLIRVGGGLTLSGGQAGTPGEVVHKGTAEREAEGVGATAWGRSADFHLPLAGFGTGLGQRNIPAVRRCDRIRDHVLAGRGG